MSLIDRLKRATRARYPRAYVAMARVKNRFAVEWRVLRHLRLRDMWRAVSRNAWMAAIPSQQARRFTVSTRFAALCNAAHTQVSGAHALYLSPIAWEQSALADLRAHYPPDAGLKVVRQEGSISSGSYVSPGPYSRLQIGMLHSHAQLSVAANVLHLSGVGPRPYDLIEIAFPDGIHVAYVGRHVQGRAPSRDEWSATMAALQRLRADDVLNVVAPGGFEHIDFREPDCNGNALVDSRGVVHYVDFQNFVLGDYESFLERAAREASAATHFGEASWLRGGRYLYQTVPGLRLPAKRDVERRMAVISEMLALSGSTLAGSTVLDVGCNLGMIIASYLRLGAAWCHGWDLPSVTPFTERLLLGVGCTRFSLSGAALSANYPLRRDVPEFVLTGRPVIVSYLAVRGHLGWLAELGTLPWSTLIYEGHEHEGRAATMEHLEQFCALTSARVAEIATYRDGDSEPRELAILTR